MKSGRTLMPPGKPAKRDVIAAIRQPNVGVMLMLGFSSGLPFLLTGNTLGYWLRDEGTTLQAIGFLSWVGLAYSLKFLWAPIVDRLSMRRCSAASAGAAAGCCSASCWSPPGSIGLSVCGPEHGLAAVGVLALVVAFASSTQDIVVDAWRIEAASDSDELGLLSAAYQLGYRAARARDRRLDPDRRQPFRLADLVHRRWRC